MSDTPAPQTRSIPAVNQKSSLPVKMVKGTISAMDRVFPGMEKRLLPLLNSYKLRLRKVLWSMRSGQDSARAGQTVITINPDLVRHCSNKEFAFAYFKGDVLDGDWDQSTKCFEDIDVYKAFEAVCKNKTSAWADTDFYKRIVEQIESGEKLWNCSTKEDFDKRCESLAELYQTIERDGYKSDAERTGNSDDPDEISVVIGRTGELLFSNGAHRMTIAKLLGVKEIPVTVTVRHKAWVQFRGELFELAKLQEHGSLYQPCLHPDLIDIGAVHACEDRFDVIKQHLPYTTGNLLDIGANMSYFTHKFEDVGFDCTASEHAELHLHFINKLKEANNKNFQVRSGSVLEDEVILAQSYNVVLALNIFHHFLKTKKLFDQLVNFLERLDTKCIFLEAHLPVEIQMDESYKNYSPEEFCKFVAEHAGLSEYELLYTAEDGRPLYLIK
jgi:hypothetical protein